MSDSLILISCSNSKAELDYGYEYFYKSGPKLVDTLSEDLQLSILGKRQKVFNWLKNGTLIDTSRQQGRRSTHAMNRNLYLGQDLGGNDQRATYLMAKERYEGQFYLPVKDYWDKIISNDHHIFILSGLYGLILPTDPIQRYSCHMTDSSLLIPHWRNCLSNIIIYFIKRHNSSNEHKINSIIDLLSEYDYQLPFDWDEIKRHKINTYHRVFNNIAEPAEILPVLGKFMAKYFTSKDVVEFPINGFLDDKFESIEGTSKIGFETDIGLLKDVHREAIFTDVKKREKDLLKQFGWLRFAYPNLSFSNRGIKNLSEVWTVTGILPSLPDSLMILNKISIRELESRASIPNKNIAFFTQELKYFKGDVWEYRFSQDGRIFFGKSKSKTWNIDSILLKKRFSTVPKYDDYLRNSIGKDNDDLV
jgi:hypothetical protein